MKLPPTAPPPAETRREQQLVQVARQLEGVFLGMLFEEMARTVPASEGLFAKEGGSEMYEEWMRSEVAQSWARSGGTGLGDQIARSLGASPEALGAAPVHALAPPRAETPRAAPRGTPPVEGVLSSAFGPRVHPVTGQAHLHEGVDLAVPEGTPVRAAFAGRVREVRRDPVAGELVVLEHAGGYTSLYAHNQQILVQPGQEISEGDVVALSGRTGRVTGPHLHFALYHQGQPVDPRRWLKFSAE